MTCNEARPLLSAYQDGELEPQQRADVEAHLQTCAECRAVLERNRNVSKSIRQQVRPFDAPASLLESTRVKVPSRWRPFGAGLAIGFAAGVAILFFYVRSQGQDVTADLVSEHVRSLMADHLIDVASSDRHTVKPWFLGKVDFAPAVPDLTADGYPLQGGRLDYIGGRPCAALIYLKARHVINVFVMPQAEARAGEVKGYNVERWRLGDLDYVAVSDVAREDLQDFEHTFRKEAKP